MAIRPSARRHGITDEQMVHALRHVLTSQYVDEGLTMFIGPDQSGRLLEVGVLLDEGPTVIHAMPARPKYLR